MTIQCDALTVINEVQTCVVLVQPHLNWLDELNQLPPASVAAILSGTALAFYVAGILRLYLKTIEHDG
jgi:formate hydrogenlyase subunit 3/multisubunit Na+/H+ antiporter MnhD subunit